MYEIQLLRVPLTASCSVPSMTSKLTLSSVSSSNTLINRHVLQEVHHLQNLRRQARPIRRTVHTKLRGKIHGRESSGIETVGEHETKLAQPADMRIITMWFTEVEWQSFHLLLLRSEDVGTCCTVLHTQSGVGIEGGILMLYITHKPRSGLCTLRSRSSHHFPKP
jgi:hypothetical protein